MTLCPAQIFRTLPITSLSWHSFSSRLSIVLQHRPFYGAHRAIPSPSIVSPSPHEEPPLQSSHAPLRIAMRADAGRVKILTGGDAYLGASSLFGSNGRRMRGPSLPHPAITAAILSLHQRDAARAIANQQQPAPCLVNDSFPLLSSHGAVRAHTAFDSVFTSDEVVVS